MQAGRSQGKIKVQSERGQGHGLDGQVEEVPIGVLTA